MHTQLQESGYKATYDVDIMQTGWLTKKGNIPVEPNCSVNLSA